MWVSGDLVPFLAVTGLVMVAPGPSVLFAVTQRLRGGPRAGLFAVLGLESGLSIHVAGACLGISAMVAASPATLGVLRALGAGYLAVLGLRLLRPGSGGDHSWQQLGGHPGNSYRAGVLVDLLNPKTVLYVVALLPQFIDRSAGSVAGQSMLLGGCVVGVALVCDGGYTLLAGYVQHRMGPPGAPVGRHGRSTTTRLIRWSGYGSGCSFLALAVVALLG